MQDDSDENIKISFQITSRQDPKLLKWLQNHPYKSTSTAIRILLNIGFAAITAIPEAQEKIKIVKKQKQDSNESSKSQKKNDTPINVTGTIKTEQNIDVSSKEIKPPEEHQIEKSINNEDDSKSCSDSEMDAAFATFNTLNGRF